MLIKVRGCNADVEVERELHNTENYKRLNHNPTTANNETVNKIIKGFHKEYLITKNIA